MENMHTHKHTHTLDGINVYQCHVYISQTETSLFGAICTSLAPVALGNVFPSSL